MTSFWVPILSLKRVKVHTSNVTDQGENYSLCMIDDPSVGCVQGHVTHLDFHK